MIKPIHYTNRKEKTYYLHAATTKTGKIRYVMTKDSEGALTELPEGYGITESINGVVSVGQIKPKLITEAEEAMVKLELMKLGLKNYRCEVKGQYITVYEPLYRKSDFSETLEVEMGLFAMLKKDFISESIEKGPFDPVMRFGVFDKKKRLFSVERMTFRGRCNWMPLSNCKTLEELVGKYLKHLGKDSFYELM